MRKDIVISEILYKPSYIRFCLQFCCHGNMGHLGVNLNDAIKLVDSQNYAIKPKITTYLLGLPYPGPDGYPGIRPETEVVSK